MARLLFVENRGKTKLWEAVALDLAARGHHVGWLVQNPQYLPHAFSDSPHVHVLSFPPANNAEGEIDEVSWVKTNCPELVTDRGRNYFGTGISHYAHYKREIESVLVREKPNFVIGEPTLFHELITIGLCRILGISYIHPCGTRYPSGRFSILAFDTQNPVCESGERLQEVEALALAKKISAGREVPSYMRKAGRREKLFRDVKLLGARTSVWWGYLKGERYNTPSLYCKIRLDRELKRNLLEWTSLQCLPSVRERTLLYPLQMQPEANIDVWGRPYSNQVELLCGILSSAPSDVQVAVKANPKSKYEVSRALLDLAAANPRICLLPLNMTMVEAQCLTVGTLTVTGTVGFEAVFGKGRALSLRHPLIEKEFPSLHAPSVSDGVDLLLNSPNAGVGNSEMGGRLIQRFVEQSFKGLINEPLYDVRCVSSENVLLIANALDKFLFSSLIES